MMPIYVTRDEEGDVSNPLVMAKTKAEENATEKIARKKSLVSENLFNFVEKTITINHLKGDSKRTFQTAVSVTEHTVFRRRKNDSSKTYFGANRFPE